MKNSLSYVKMILQGGIMKGIFSLFILISSTLAQAATVDSTTIECDYVTASAVIAYYEPKVMPSQIQGKITLVKDGKVFKGEVPFDVFNMKVEAEIIGSDLSLNLNIHDVKYATSKKIVATAASLHRVNEAGIYQGTAILRSPQVATVALQADVAYEVAPLEKLSTGNNFLGAYLTCY